jgi:hypothetical protein
VSTLVHANKTEAVSREGGSQPFDPSALRESRVGKPVYKRPLCNPDTEKKACVLSLRIHVHPCPVRVEYVSVSEKSRERIS